MSVIPRFTSHAQEYTCGATKNEPNSATVVVEVPKSPRFFTNHYGTTTIHTDVSAVLLHIMPLHHDLINRGES